LITKFGKRFLASYLSGMINSPEKDLAFGIDSTAVQSNGNDTRLGFEFYRVPASFGSIDIQTDESGNSTYSVVYQATIPQDVAGIIKEIGLYPNIKSSVNNYDSKFIADFENNLMWFKSDDSNPELVDSTTSDISPRVGSYFSKIGVSASQSSEFVCSYSGLDLSGYTASDSLSLAYNQQDTNLDSITFKFYSSDSSYYTATFAGASSVTEPNKIGRVLFSTLTANNAYADLSSIIKIGVVITAKSSGQAVVYLDALRIDDEDTFDANFGLISRSALSSGNEVIKIAGKPVDIEYRINLGF
jgi:hypothetical protein